MPKTSLRLKTADGNNGLPDLKGGFFYERNQHKRSGSYRNRSGVAHDGDGNPITFYPWSSSSYGEPDGILGINCHHHKYPFVDGVNFQRYFPYDKDENEERYKEFQKQRAMERRVRETSRQADMLEATGDTEGAKEVRRKLREQRKAYREYSDEHGLAVHNDRLTVVKVKNGDTSYKNIYASALDKSDRSGIIKERFNSISDPMYEVTGSAYTSHPQEIKKIEETLTEWGVEIIKSHSLGYGSPSVGDPGGMSVTPNASYSAWLHEFQHVKDSKENGWDCARVLYEDPSERIQRERKAYQIEIDLANQYGRPDIAKRLEENLNAEIENINKFFGLIP